jgi:hypothetical protein
MSEPVSPPDHISAEHRRIGERRQAQGLEYPSDLADRPIGLALSGGGIRSATFSLGAMQALSLARSPLAPRKDEDESKSSSEPSWLQMFDYLSTVSGGGYIGAFFISLFVPGRYRSTSRGSNAQAANDAYAALRYAPPGRMRSEGTYTEAGSGPMAWLRDNGRYLTPSGGGDMTYAIGLTLRNWFAIHYVIGTLAATAFGLLALLRHWIANGVSEYRALEAQLLQHASGERATDIHVWWSTTWIIPLSIIALWLIPAGWAYWLTYPRRHETTESKARVLSFAAALDLAAGIVLTACWFRWHDSLNADGRVFGHGALAIGVIMLLGYLFYVAPVIVKRVSIAQHRVVLTRALANGLVVMAGFIGLATINTLAQTFYLLLHKGLTGWSVSMPVIIGALAWLFRRIAAASDERALPSWIARLPIGVIAGFAAGLLLLLVLTLWALLMVWIEWHGVELIADNVTHHARSLQAGIATLFFLLISIANGHFSGFVNLSTLQSLYGARLTRAYLGASNGARFEAKARKEKSFSVAEPMRNDGLDHTTYYANPLAPVHIINITVNQTVDPSEQLTQRDRKGKPMALLPNGFTVDGKYCPFKRPESLRATRMQRYKDKLTKAQELTIGQWIGVSGAAFTTGLGRTTSLGISLALGLANVRLGLWWPSSYGEDRSGWLERIFKAVFKTQTYLYYEMTARFFGMHREWQYLSDGGHFENTGLYELLRPERRCRLIVLCDNGADPHYEFGDLAGLIRLVRIDYRLNIELDEEVLEDEVLRRHFGHPAEFQQKLANKEVNDKCALMFNVRRCAPDHDELLCKIIVLKPCMITAAPLDVLQTPASIPRSPTSQPPISSSTKRSGKAIASSDSRLRSASSDRVMIALALMYGGMYCGA